MLSMIFSLSPSVRASVNNFLRHATESYIDTKVTLKRQSTVDHFAKLVKEEKENPRSQFSPEEIDTAAKKIAREMAEEKQRRVDYAFLPVDNSIEKAQTILEAQGWNAYPNSLPIPEGMPYDKESKWRAKNVFNTMLIDLEDSKKEKPFHLGMLYK